MNLDRSIDSLSKKLLEVEKQDQIQRATRVGKSQDEQEREDRARYRAMKEAYYFHKSSSYMRNSNDGQGCKWMKCIPECEYYAEEGKLRKDGKIY